VLHLVELQQLLDELERVLPRATLRQLLHLEVLSKEGRRLDRQHSTFLLAPSCESIVLNTDERICARMLLR
jgi:hypothetical protein